MQNQKQKHDLTKLTYYVDVWCCLATIIDRFSNTQHNITRESLLFGTESLFIASKKRHAQKTLFLKLLQGPLLYSKKFLLYSLLFLYVKSN